MKDFLVEFESVVEPRTRRHHVLDAEDIPVAEAFLEQSGHNTVVAVVGAEANKNGVACVTLKIRAENQDAAANTSIHPKNFDDILELFCNATGTEWEAVRAYEDEKAA